MQTQPGAPAQLFDLDPDECWELAAGRPVGRLAWTGSHGRPVVIPVNFTVDGHAVHIRTSAYSEAARRCDDSPVAFEVDTFDATERSGWSVLMRGVAHVDLYEPIGPNDPEPWAGGTRRLRLRVEVDEITGRRVAARG
jgi:nitroimidazol reductase NimA-like FMN-containing flavoprotein (pyridoxamine 5'-phosphate oxidase superfamily)